MKSDLVSVVICTKDRPQMLIQCLESIKRGMEVPGEIVVIDQSLNESTASVVHRFAESCSIPVRYVHLESVGLAAARNVGMKVVHGEVVSFTDDDCLVDQSWIQVIAAEFDDGTLTCVCGHTLPIGHAGRPKQALISTLNHRSRRRVTGKSNPILVGRGNNMAFRRSDLLRLGGFNEQMGVGAPVNAGEDMDILYRLLETGGTIMHVPDAIVLHSQPEDCRSIICKKHGYAVAAAAILASRVRYGDKYAGMLLAGKILYEFGYLFCGGLVRMNGLVARIGWSSFLGSLYGVRRSMDREFHVEVHRLTNFARDSKTQSVETAELEVL